eukprot:390164-Amphidinium_carterae.2
MERTKGNLVLMKDVWRHGATAALRKSNLGGELRAPMPLDPKASSTDIMLTCCCCRIGSRVDGELATTEWRSLVSCGGGVHVHYRNAMGLAMVGLAADLLLLLLLV